MIRSLFPVVASLCLLPQPAFADGDAAAGQNVFMRCASCHNVANETYRKMGPTLHGIVGRPVASVKTYGYSDAMKTFGATGAVWDESTLDKFLKEPTIFVKGTKMMAPPVRKDTERADLIAFLKAQ